MYENALENFAGNAAEYSLDGVAVLENSPLKGKRILFLGSSVTRGACSLDTSMADYIGKIDGDRFDTTTVAGAIEYIIAYCKATWGCPVVFYTGTKYDSENYANITLVDS